MERLGFDVITCPAEMMGEALELLYRNVPSVLRERIIVQMLSQEYCGEIDLSGLWVAKKRTGGVVGAMLTQQLAGKVAAVWAPEVRNMWHRSNLSAVMIKVAVADFAARGFKLVQAVLDESASPHAARDLEKGGLQRVTELLYLERETAIPLEFVETSTVREKLINKEVAVDFARRNCSPTAFNWCSFDETLEAEFRSVILATYIGSLDMPELEGARSLDDILESHRSTGRFMAKRWRLGQTLGDSEASAVLLLTEVPGRNAWEVIYLGLTPAARGRHLGRTILEHALELARGHVGWLQLVVDVRNTPALQLYNSAGFVARERRTVHLTIFPRIIYGGVSDA